MASEQKLMHIVAVLCESFGRKPTPLTYEAYELALSDIDDEALSQAATKAAKSCKFMPTPAELRELAGCVTEADRGLLAWAAVERSIHLGPYRHVDFDDRAINAAIRNLGGWVSFLSRFTDAEAEKWVRQEFLKVYATYARATIGDEEGAPLAGLAEAVCTNGRLSPPEPIRIAAKTGRIDPPRLGHEQRPQRCTIRGGEPKRIGSVMS